MSKLKYLINDEIEDMHLRHIKRKEICAKCGKPVLEIKYLSYYQGKAWHTYHEPKLKGDRWLKCT